MVIVRMRYSRCITLVRTSGLTRLLDQSAPSQLNMDDDFAILKPLASIKCKQTISYE